MDMNILGAVGSTILGFVLKGIGAGRAAKIMDDAQETAKKFYEEGETAAQEYLDKIDTSRSSASDLYKEGREVAGQVASDKAGIAKKEAKAASAMQGGSKLMNAIQGSQAAVDATQKGFDETVTNAAGLAASQENAEKSAEANRLANKASTAYNAAAGKAGTASSMGSQRAGLAQTSWGSLGDTASKNASAYMNRGEK